jgi:hypothetical protein
MSARKRAERKTHYTASRGDAQSLLHGKKAEDRRDGWGFTFCRFGGKIRRNVQRYRMLRFAAQRRHFSAREGESKMQKKNNKGVIALIIVLVLAAAALVIWQTNKRETQQGGKEITINVDHLNGDDTTFTIHTDEEYLRGALEQEDLIEGTESEYGLYVLTVDGETADESEQQWWGYSVNGTFAELGVDSQPVADGDVYDFVLNVGW